MSEAVPETPTYRVYIDDSGTKEYRQSRVYDNSCTKYLIFGAVLVEANQASRIVQTLQRYKLATFGTTDIELKSNWLRIPDETRSRYLEPYGVSEAQLGAFVELYYDELARSDFQFIGAVVDKIQMQEKYTAPYEPHYPPAACYELILQRAENALREKKGTFSVFIDDMSGKTPKQSEYNENLKRQHASLKNNGSSILTELGSVRRFQFTTLRGDVKIVDSKHFELIQVADIAAYNLYRQFVQYGEAWEDHTLVQLPMYPYFARLIHKFRQDPDGRIQGFGVVKLPRGRSRKWKVQK